MRREVALVAHKDTYSAAVGVQRALDGLGCGGLTPRLATMGYIIPMRWKVPEATSLPDPVRIQMVVPAEHPGTPLLREKRPEPPSQMCVVPTRVLCT
jgi:hypothetical protein